jgi:hypothetical protein
VIQDGNQGVAHGWRGSPACEAGDGCGAGALDAGNPAALDGALRTEAAEIGSMDGRRCGTGIGPSSHDAGEKGARAACLGDKPGEGMWMGPAGP